MVVTFFVFGSYKAIWRPLWVIGYACADGCVDPSRQNADVWLPRTRDATQTRACSSIAKLWALAWLFQITSSPQNWDEAAGLVAPVVGVFGSRTSSFTCDDLLATGSTTGM